MATKADRKENMRRHQGQQRETASLTNPSPNPKAVEAAWPEKWVTRREWPNGVVNFYFSGKYHPTNQDVLPQRLYAPVDHIRSQVLTELAEEFERRCNAAQNLGAREALSEVEGYCRELAAKEES